MALGKGLGALIPDIANTEINGEPSYKEISTDSITPNPDQPRTVFDEVKLNELAESIKNHGIIEPLVVTRNGDEYKIVTGERRWRAACLAGLDKVPVICMEVSDDDLLELAIIENVQREDLNPIELATGYKLLIDRFGYTHDELSKRIGVSRPYITNALRILTLTDKVQQLINENKISFGAARALTALEDGNVQESLAQAILDEGLNVRQVEARVKKLSKPNKPGKPKEKEMDPYLKDLEERLSSKFDTKVNVSKSRNKGKIEINYSSMEQLNGILEIIGILMEEK